MIEILHCNKAVTLYNRDTDEIINVGDHVSTEYDRSGIVRFGLCEDMTINCDEYDLPYFGFYLDMDDKGYGVDYGVESRGDIQKWRLV